ncbi:MliC family protein [Saezia sanguinis]|uniref:MliC family protein n=1 Tax=Saezia sanguinis TaxID=1965230 RepID=UPI00305E9955
MKPFSKLIVAASIAAPAAAFAVTPITYTCEDGQNIQVAYPDHFHAIVIQNDDVALLKHAISASGARYVGGGWQWWGKGMNEGTLSTIKEGEAVASDKGRFCRVPAAAAQQ